MFGQQPMYPLSEIDAPLPTVAPTDEGSATPFAQVVGALLDKGALPSQPLDEIALSCIAYALSRICLDAAAQQAFTKGNGEWGESDEWTDERERKVTTPVYALPVPAYKIQ